MFKLCHIELGSHWLWQVALPSFSLKYFYAVEWSQKQLCISQGNQKIEPFSTSFNFLWAAVDSTGMFESGAIGYLKMFHLSFSLLQFWRGVEMSSSIYNQDQLPWIQTFLDWGIFIIHSRWISVLSCFHILSSYMRTGLNFTAWAVTQKHSKN